MKVKRFGFEPAAQGLPAHESSCKLIAGLQPVRLRLAGARSAACRRLAAEQPDSEEQLPAGPCQAAQQVLRLERLAGLHSLSRTVAA